LRKIILLLAIKEQRWKTPDCSANSPLSLLLYPYLINRPEYVGRKCHPDPTL